MVSQNYSPSDNVSHPTPSPTDIESSPQTVHQLVEDDEEQVEDDKEGEEQEEISEVGGIMVAEMEPDDNFVSLEPPSQDQSEFGDDHFEATENWSSQVRIQTAIFFTH